MFPRFIIWLKRSRFITTEHCPTGWPRFWFLLLRLDEREGKGGRGGEGVVYIAQTDACAGRCGLAWQLVVVGSGAGCWVGISECCGGGGRVVLTACRISSHFLPTCLSLSLRIFDWKCPKLKWSEVVCGVCFPGWRLITVESARVNSEGYLTFH